MSTKEELNINDSVSFMEMTRYFIPLLLSTASQALTYPLVGRIVTRGTTLGAGMGTIEYSVFAQAQTIMFLVGAIGAGLVVTGMVFAKSHRSMSEFTKLSLILGAIAILMQIAACIPPFDTLVIQKFLHLTEPDKIKITKQTLIFCTLMNFTFFVRNAPQVALLNSRRTHMISTSTIGRIIATWGLSNIFLKFGLIGYLNGIICMTIPVVMETVFLYIASRPEYRALAAISEDRSATWLKQLIFTLPLSLGGICMTASATILARFLNLAAGSSNAALAVAVHYIAWGIANPASAGANRTQAVFLTFANGRRDRWLQILKFSVIIGVILSLIPLIFFIPPVARAYFAGEQNLSPENIPMALKAMAVVIPMIPMRALLGFAEGDAAFIRKPIYVLFGQIAYVLSLILIEYWMLRTKLVPVHLMGVWGILLSTVISIFTIMIFVFINRRKNSNITDILACPAC
ncbi:MAG: hypothetical protein GX804_03570 [Lentisphaerae bacterium]|jgi:hypothetical protein|nr:hypothetical protein [Lentisphaerota bacterium]